jgi:hypothetical protein
MESTAKVGKDAENTSDQIGTFSDEIKNAGKELDRVLMKEQEAAEKYEGARDYKQSLVQNIVLPKGGFSSASSSEIFSLHQISLPFRSDIRWPN